MSLLYAIETCLRATKVPPSRFGREAVKDPRLVHDLRRGRQPGAAVEHRVRAHIAAMLAASEAKMRSPQRCLVSIGTCSPSATMLRGAY